MKRVVIYSVSLILFFISCSGITPINDADFYSEDLLKQLESIQVIYKDGDKKRALQKLTAIQDNKLSRAEVAKKYNLVGVIYYASQSLTQAIESFQVARQNVDKDYGLANRIRLNLASSYFKSDQVNSTANILKLIDTNYLNKAEKVNFHKLNFTVANQLNDFKKVIKSILFLSKDTNSFSEFEDFKYKEVIMDNFKKLSASERVYLLERHMKENPIVIAYLGRAEAMNRFYIGDREGSKDVVDWLRKRFDYLEEIKIFVDDYQFRVDNYSKINSGAIGVLVPLSGKVAKYGEKVISGVNTALNKQKNTETFLNIHIKDNQNNTYLAKKMVQELVIKHHVSVIIGGLFPALAKEEYLEARKYGVMYVSLSPVYLPRSEKNHLLLELPGSIESQLNSLTKPEVLEKLGRRVGVLYPWSIDGKSYVNELWNLNNMNKLELKNVYHYQRGIKDYRKPVEEILGLKYPREREEELQVWKEIKNIDKRNMRIINTLPPVTDFDWMFIPSLPSEALQILPTFSYYDAKKVKFVGGPSWINNKLKANRRDLGQMYVIGTDLSNISKDFIKMYRTLNGRAPHLLDTLSYEGMEIVLDIVKEQKFSAREDLEKRVRDLKKLEALTSSWTLDEGLWVKNMDILSIKSSGFEKVSFE